MHLWQVCSKKLLGHVHDISGREPGSRSEHAGCQQHINKRACESTCFCAYWYFLIGNMVNSHCKFYFDLFIGTHERRDKILWTVHVWHWMKQFTQNCSGMVAQLMVSCTLDPGFWHAGRHMLLVLLTVLHKSITTATRGIPILDSCLFQKFN